MRATMLPPMRPRPTNPIWLKPAGSPCSSAVSSRTALADPRHRNRSPLRRAPASAQRLEIAERLRVLQRPERERLAGDLDVLGAVVHEHEEADRSAGPALVQLAGRVQVARAVAERRRGLRRVADRGAQLRDRGVDRLARRHEAEDRDVVARARLAEQRAQGVVVGIVGLGQLAARRNLRQQLAGRVLGDLHVGLVEGVDLQRPAGDRGRELGEEEDPAEVLGPAGRQRDGRLTGGGERPDARVELVARVVVVAQIAEDPIVAVDVRARRAARR